MVVLRLAMERAREALSISFADTGEVAFGEVGVVVLELDLGEVGLTSEWGFGGTGLTVVVLDFGDVGPALGLGEEGGSLEELMLRAVDWTASLTEPTTWAPVAAPPTLPTYL